MAVVPTSPQISVEEYQKTSYPDGDREYLDSVVMERNIGSPSHSALQKILIVHLAAFESGLQIAVRPECRTRIQETRYRVPDIDEAIPSDRPGVLDAPLLIIEILSADDRMKDAMQRFSEYEKLGVRYVVQMDGISPASRF